MWQNRDAVSKGCTRRHRCAACKMCRSIVDKIGKNYERRARTSGRCCGWLWLRWLEMKGDDHQYRLWLKPVSAFWMTNTSRSGESKLVRRGSPPNKICLETRCMRSFARMWEWKQKARPSAAAKYPLSHSTDDIASMNRLRTEGGDCKGWIFLQPNAAWSEHWSCPLRVCWDN